MILYIRLKIDKNRTHLNLIMFSFDKSNMLFVINSNIYVIASYI